jgi:enoyl-[acyl-carrier protein] reductase III
LTAGERWALVTGGNRGIGKAVALDLAGNGYDIIVAYLRNEEEAERTAAALRELGRNVVLVAENLATAEGCSMLIEDIRSRASRLHGVVHCAALGALSPVLSTRPNRWQLTWETHVGALLRILEGAKDLLVPGAGVVAMTSIGSRRVMPGYASIAAAKGALEALTRYLAVELMEKHINVNAVCGGPVDTGSLRSFASFSDLEEECRRRPGGRLGRPEDLAPVVSFLLSPEAAWIRGQVIVADGGFGLV